MSNSTDLLSLQSVQSKKIIVHNNEFISQIFLLFSMDHHPFFYLLMYILFVKYILYSVVYGQLYHVIPHTGTPSPQEPCISPSQFAINSSIYASNTSNIIVYFLPGLHSLDLEITVSNLHNFTLTNYMRGDDIAVVKCTAHLAKLNTTFVLIGGWLYL